MTELEQMGRDLAKAMARQIGPSISNPLKAGRPKKTKRLRLEDLKIRTKDKRLTSFVPNEVQTLYLRTLFPGWTDKDSPWNLEGLREINLKGRQFGISTLILALFFINTVEVPNTTTAIIAHKDDSTQNLFNIIKLYYESMPESRRPVAKYNSRKEYFWPDINSRIVVGTAGSKDFGRSFTINNVHMSEVAFWDNGDSIVQGLLQAVPDNGNIFAESTANGTGNWFEEEWQLTKEFDKFGEVASRFTPRFWSWRLHKEYQATGAQMGGWSKKNPEEEVLAKAYDLTDRQLMWRRMKIKELKNYFVQEYPINDEEAFITTGNNFFSPEKIKELQNLLNAPEYDPIPQSDMEIPAVYKRLNQERDNLSNPRNALGQDFYTLSLWKYPDPGHFYCLGNDTASGLDDEGDHDYCVTDIWDTATWDQVAQLRGRWEPEFFAGLTAELFMWYNMGLVIPERNEYGHAFIAKLMDREMVPLQGQEGAGGIYRHEEYSEKKALSRRLPGWPNQPKNRMQMLSTLYQYFENGNLIIRSRVTAAEMRTFIKHPGGKIEHAKKKKDDTIFAMGLSLLGFKAQFNAATSGVKASDGVKDARPNTALSYAQATNPYHMPDLGNEVV